ncbi:hypothetical protein L3137_08925 [Bacillus sonorensis]|uniref:hypothetical protein n=1 Tax=Bacillus sonorensis TaxID=119858 RepID=UPI001F187F65|nr:hypothetical protein [Bacillus sonorensis]MCF7617399.1 hypothetical protein [Bacillus sonorensis]
MLPEEAKGKEIKMYLVVEDEGGQTKHIPIVPSEKCEWIDTPDITIKSETLKDIQNKTILDYERAFD